MAPLETCGPFLEMMGGFCQIRAGSVMGFTTSSQIWGLVTSGVTDGPCAAQGTPSKVLVSLQNDPCPRQTLSLPPKS